jgi:hypothetical protein
MIQHQLPKLYFFGRLSDTYEVGDIKDIAKQIPGISPNEAEKLVDGAGKNAQATLA